MATQPLLYTLHIQLEPLNFNPPVWRRLRVNGDCTLRKLHHFIQAAFGWHSSHLSHSVAAIHHACRTHVL